MVSIKYCYSKLYFCVNHSVVITSSFCVINNPSRLLFFKSVIPACTSPAMTAVAKQSVKVVVGPTIVAETISRLFVHVVGLMIWWYGFPSTSHLLLNDQDVETDHSLISINPKSSQGACGLSIAITKGEWSSFSPCTTISHQKLMMKLRYHLFWRNVLSRSTKYHLPIHHRSRKYHGCSDAIEVALSREIYLLRSRDNVSWVFSVGNWVGTKFLSKLVPYPTERTDTNGWNAQLIWVVTSCVLARRSINDLESVTFSHLFKCDSVEVGRNLENSCSNELINWSTSEVNCASSLEFMSSYTVISQWVVNFFREMVFMLYKGKTTFLKCLNPYV